MSDKIISITYVEDVTGHGQLLAGGEIPASAWDALIKVAMWVSRGRSFAFTPDPELGPCYPDASARRALGALHEAGLLKPLTQEET